MSKQVPAGSTHLTESPNGPAYITVNENAGWMHAKHMGQESVTCQRDQHLHEPPGHPPVDVDDATR